MKRGGSKRGRRKSILKVVEATTNGVSEVKGSQV